MVSTRTRASDVKPPLCAVCGRQVDRLSVYEDPMRDELVFTVQCHGRMEEARVEMELFVAFDRFEIGRVFESKELSP